MLGSKISKKPKKLKTIRKKFRQFPLSKKESDQEVNEEPFEYPFEMEKVSEETKPKTEQQSCGADGCWCKKCNDFYKYAEPNQEDGTLICWSCRQIW